MVVQREIVDCGSMCVDNKGQRPGFPSIKYGLREEKKKVILISRIKYYKIEDYEIGMHRFCLIRNTLSRLQHEEDEEPSPPCDMEVADVLSIYSQPVPSPITALSDDEDELPLCKRPRLFIDDDEENDKENSYEDRLIDVVGDKEESSSMGEVQDILREMYDSNTGDNLSQSRLSSSKDLSCKSNINTSSRYFDNGGNLRISGCMEWLKFQQQLSQFLSNHSALLSNNLQPVVSLSLITSL